MSQRLGMGRGGEGGSRLSCRWGGPGGGTGWYCTSSGWYTSRTGFLQVGRWTRLQTRCGSGRRTRPRWGVGRRRCAGWAQGCRPARFSHRETACSSPQGRTHRVGYTTQKTKARVGEAKGTPNVPSGRRKSPAEAVLVQANVRQVPAHMVVQPPRVRTKRSNLRRAAPRTDGAFPARPHSFLAPVNKTRRQSNCVGLTEPPIMGLTEPGKISAGY